MTASTGFWYGKRVLITGHTGFKGSWLSLWLGELGADVHGFALEPPTDPSLFAIAGVGRRVGSSIGDVRDADAVLRCIVAVQPDIIFHMAAQPLVRLSYEQPVATFATNVMGTVHVLDAASRVGTARAIVNVTTDKCYENRDWPWGYRETDAMGGHDPYSASKACAELVTAAYRRSFFSDRPAVATARAGNVIGGGDWAADRLVPDILRAFERREPVVVRSPASVRPWQHVLEPLSGYVRLAERLWEGEDVAEAWNFGPADDDVRPVAWIAGRMAELWGDNAAWTIANGVHPHEAHTLRLDIAKARIRLDWHPRWNLPTALTQTIAWHKAWRAGCDMRAVCLDEIALYTGAIDRKLV